jgi:hypothetical protein
VRCVTEAALENALVFERLVDRHHLLRCERRRQGWCWRLGPWPLLWLRIGVVSELRARVARLAWRGHAHRWRRSTTAL